MFIHIIQIKGLWICDIHFLRELETRVWLKYAVHVWDQLYQTATSTASTPEGSSKNTTALISIQGEYLGIRIETFNCLMEEKEVTSLQMVDQATQNRNLRTPYRSGACHNETQSIRGTSTKSTKKNFKISISQGTQRRCLSTPAPTPGERKC